MERSCNFYSCIPGFRLVYGGSHTDSFTTYEIGSGESRNNSKMYLNLKLTSPTIPIILITMVVTEEIHFGRIIFHTEDVDKLYSYLRNKEDISNTILFEDEPKDAPWGERYFHLREPDGYQLSFAKPLKKRKTTD